MFDDIHWKQRKELQGLSQAIKAEVLQRDNKHLKYHAHVVAFVATTVGVTEIVVQNNPNAMYRKALALIKSDMGAQAAPSRLVASFSTGTLNFNRHYGVVAKRLVGLPRPVSFSSKCLNET